MPCVPVSGMMMCVTANVQLARLIVLLPCLFFVNQVKASIAAIVGYSKFDTGRECVMRMCRCLGVACVAVLVPFLGIDLDEVMIRPTICPDLTGIVAEIGIAKLPGNGGGAECDELSHDAKMYRGPFMRAPYTTKVPVDDDVGEHGIWYERDSVWPSDLTESELLIARNLLSMLEDMCAMDLGVVPAAWMVRFRLIREALPMMGFEALMYGLPVGIDDGGAGLMTWLRGVREYLSDMCSFMVFDTVTVQNAEWTGGEGRAAVRWNGELIGWTSGQGLIELSGDREGVSSYPDLETVWALEGPRVPFQVQIFAPFRSQPYLGEFVHVDEGV